MFGLLNESREVETNIVTVLLASSRIQRDSLIVFLVIEPSTDCSVCCRWGNTPMDEAVHFGHHDVVTILRDYHTQYSPQEPPTDKQSAEKNLDGML